MDHTHGSPFPFEDHDDVHHHGHGDDFAADGFEPTPSTHETTREHAPPSPFGRGWISEPARPGLPDHAALARARTAAADLRARRMAAAGLVQVASEEDWLTGGEGAWVAEAPALTPEGYLEHRPAQQRHDGWTDDRRRLFLDHLAHRGQVRAACSLADMSVASAYKLRRRDAAFAAAWDAALVLSRPTYEEALAVRALDGLEEQVWYRGELVGVRYKQDSRLLLAHLARLDRHAETTPHAAERAGRFDELIALACGARVPEALETWRGREEPPRRRAAPDPLLPLPRERHVAEAAERARREGRWDALAEIMEQAEAAGRGVVDWYDRRESEIPLSDEERAALDAAAEAAFAEAEEDAAEAWDAWRAQALAVADGAVADGAAVDEVEEEEAPEEAGEPEEPGEEPEAQGPADPPLECESLDTVNSVNFVSWHGEPDAGNANLDQPGGTAGGLSDCLLAASEGGRTVEAHRHRRNRRRDRRPDGDRAGAIPTLDGA
jgi:hypothetical protein